MIARHTLRTPAPRTPATLEELIAREHRRVAKLFKERRRVQRKLETARIRLSTYIRMANDARRRGTAAELLAAGAKAVAFDARGVACPTCRAPIGAPCKRPSGHPVFGGGVHAPRGRAATAAAKGGA